MKCANCPADAKFYQDSIVANPVAYCSGCLPPPLVVAAAAGALALPEPKAPAKK